jgi:subtilisin family serine protease
MFAFACTSRAAAVLAIVAVALASGPVRADDSAAKKPVTSQNDLPRFTYPVTGTAQAIVDDAATFAAFAKPVRADVEATLQNYDIQDHAALRGLLGLELDFQILSGSEDAAALQTLARIRDLQDKPDAKLTTGLPIEALLKARTATQASSGPAFEAAFDTQYRAELAALPWDVVSNRIKEAKSNQEIISASILDGIVQADVEPALEKSHALSNDLAAQLVNIRFQKAVGLGLKPLVLPALTAYVAANDVKKPDIWAARDIVFPANAALKPVRIGIWDSGTDPSVYAKALVVDPHPGPNNPHGLAFDLHGFRSPSDLYPLTPEQQQRYLTFRTYLKGLSDLQSSIDSPEASSLKAYLASLAPSDVPSFFEAAQLFDNYSHGSHVTGIAIKGNPAARVVIARISFDYRNVPAPPNEPDEQLSIESYKLVVAYFKQHGVRVVNMSWGGTPNDIEVALEKNGIGKDAAERKKIARHYFDEDSMGLRAAIASAPGILFVCAAGNSDSNATFGDFAPSSFGLPNMLAVGAVDQAGDPASFTSYGPTVLVDADGYQVPSTIPGGYVVPFSGTSMASPNVANLAAKLIAVDPKLTPEKTIELIRAGATTSADGRLHLIDPARSLQLLEQHAGT